jgi:hypothetical protein
VLEVGVSEGIARRVWVQADMWLERLLLCKEEGRVTTLPHGLHTIVDAAVPDGGHTTVAT